MVFLPLANGHNNRRARINFAFRTVLDLSTKIQKKAFLLHFMGIAR
jgi:hypothetical protein